MLITTKEEGIELLNKALPYPGQMKNIDLKKENAIYFDWRNQRYRLDFEYCRVDSCRNGLLYGDDASILMTKCLQFARKCI